MSSEGKCGLSPRILVTSLLLISRYSVLILAVFLTDAYLEFPALSAAELSTIVVMYWPCILLMEIVGLKIYLTATHRYRE
ncbi:hypothetical protein V1511DRAFT_499064 [Dipodascopsis uninucleata]